MRNSAHQLLFASALCVAYSSGQCANWVVLQAAESRASVPAMRWRAQIAEESLAAKRSATLVGNTGETENWNRRLLVIEAAGEKPGTWMKRQEYQVPSRTVLGDPCSVRSAEISNDHGTLELAIMYEFACGSGASTNVIYKLEVMSHASRIAAFQWNQASRDQLTSIEVNYGSGQMSILRSSPEDEYPGPLIIRSIQKVAPTLDRQGLLRCQHPLLGERIEGCHP